MLTSTRNNFDIKKSLKSYTAAIDHSRVRKGAFDMALLRVALEDNKFIHALALTGSVSCRYSGGDDGRDNLHDECLSMFLFYGTILYDR